jgi:hypothetical protein
MELKGPEIAVDVASFNVLVADVVVLDPVTILNDFAGVVVAPEVGEASELEICPVAVFEGLLISIFPTQHDGVPSGEQQYCSDEQPPSLGKQHVYPAGRQPFPQDTLPSVAHVSPPPGVAGQSVEVLSQQMDPPVASRAQVWVSVKQPIKPPGLQQLQSGSI